MKRISERTGAARLVHTVVVTAANVAGIAKTAELLHGQETHVYADAGYTGVQKRPEIASLARPIGWQIARKRGRIKALAEGAQKEAIKAAEHAKASVRAFAEHPFPHREKPLPVPENAVPADWRKRPPAPHALHSGQPGDRRPLARGVSPPRRGSPGALARGAAKKNRRCRAPHAPQPSRPRPAFTPPAAPSVLIKPENTVPGFIQRFPSTTPLSNWDVSMMMPEGEKRVWQRGASGSEQRFF
jgi:IS5 family transposase